jgi:lipopolysaccharide transport system permease protein
MTLFVKRTIAVQYKQTVLGPLWWIIQPAFTVFMYMVVFGGIAGIPTDGIPQPLFYLGGIAMWQYFSDCLSKTSNTFVSNSGIFGKVYFPRLTVPISNILLSVIEFLVSFLLVTGLSVWYSLHGTAIPFMTWFMIPVVLLWLGLLGMGLGILVSSFTTKYRDLQILVNFGVRLWMYGTPIVYPLSKLNEGPLRTAVLYNPVTAPVEVFRRFVFGIGGISFGWIVYSLVFTAIAVFVGIILFNRIERSFMDTI